MSRIELPGMGMADDLRVKLAEEYISLLNQGDETQSIDLLGELCRLSGCEAAIDEVFAGVGKQARDMHDSNKDSRIRALTDDAPDTSERLRHVIEMIEESAHSTVAAVENTLPILAALTIRADDLNSLLTTYCSRCEESNALKLIKEELTDFLTQVSGDSEQVNKTLNEIIVLQSLRAATVNAVSL